MKSQKTKNKALELCDICDSKPIHAKRMCSGCYAKNYYRTHPDSYSKHKKKNAERNRNNNAKFKEIVFSHYGKKCNCCGEYHIEFLTIDHVYSDGYLHRKELGTKGTLSMYKWIIKNKFPDTIQILCWNCNCAKNLHGKCPHQNEKPEN